MMRAVARLVADDALQALIGAPAEDRKQILADALANLDDETMSLATGMIIGSLLDRDGDTAPGTASGADVAYAAIDVVHDVMTHDWSPQQRADRLREVFAVTADQGRLYFTVATSALDLVGPLYGNHPDEARRWREGMLPLAIALGEEQSAARALLDNMNAGDERRPEGN